MNRVYRNIGEADLFFGLELTQLVGLYVEFWILKEVNPFEGFKAFIFLFGMIGASFLGLQAYKRRFGKGRLSNMVAYLFSPKLYFPGKDEFFDRLQ